MIEHGRATVGNLRDRLGALLLLCAAWQVPGPRLSLKDREIWAEESCMKEDSHLQTEFR